MAKKKRRSMSRVAAPVAVVLIIILVVAAAFWLLRLWRVRLNLLVIFIDTLRADHVSCYGYERKTTPNIDLLASQGHRFSNAYTSIPTTLPAHTSLFTSLYATQLSVRRNGEKVPPGATTLAEVLADSGYHTGAFVSGASLNVRYGLNQGFKTYEDAGTRKAERAAETLDKAVKWLRNRDKKPFFLFVHFFDPHNPYNPPPQFSTLFQSEKKRMLKPGLIPKRKQVGGESLNYYDYVDRYDEEIAYSDWATGELMQELQRQGLEENTLVVLLSDHGETLGELLTRYGYVFDHGKFLYTYELHVPMIIREPVQVVQQTGMVHAQPISIVDVMPTILDLLDVEIPGLMEGVSLRPMMRGEEMSRGPVFSERRSFEKTATPYNTGNAYSIIEGKWHMISSTVSGNELYDPAGDPCEVTNLFKPGQKGAEVLGDKLRLWRSGLKPLFGPSTFETNKEALEQLRSLGYVE